MATSYSTLPSSTYVGLGSQGNPYRSTTYGTYDSGIGSLTSHPYQHQVNTYENNPLDNQHNNGYSSQQHQNAPTNNYAQQPTYNQQHQQQPLNDYSNSQTLRNNDRPLGTNNNNNHEGYTTRSTTQPPHKKNTDYQHVESQGYQQTSYGGATQHRVDNQHHQSQSNLAQSEHQIPNHPSKQHQQHKSQPPAQSNLTRSEHQISKKRLTPPLRHRSPSNDNNKYASETVPKTFNPSFELKPTKSSQMRAAAIKKKEQTREQKRNDAFFPSSQNKFTPIKLKAQQQSPQTDAEQSGSEKSKRNKTQSHSPPKSKKNRQTDDEQSDSEKSRRNQKPSHSLPKSKKNRQTDDEQSDGEKFKQNKKQSHSLPKSRKHRQTDGEQSDIEKSKRNKKQSQVPPKQHKSRRDDYRTEDNNSSADDDNNKHHRSKSKKRATFSDSHIEKHPHLPPLRHGRLPPYHDPVLDYPLPPGHPLRGRYPYHADYPPLGPYPYPGRYDHRHLYEDAYDVPPYLASYHDPYDGFFDYEKRKAKPKGDKTTNTHHTDHEDHRGIPGHETEREDGAKSQQSRKSRNRNINNKSNNGGRKSHREYDEHGHPYLPHDYYPPPFYDKRDMLEMWRQERNDYLKKKFKPTIHDVLYSQQWMKADGYLENQRRRAVRDAQGYYFPYKKYTLKDYKDLQKVNTQNPFADVNETTIDRKERARKRQEYGSQIERQVADNSGARQAPPHEMSPRKPWHLNNGEPNESEKASKRERALEYAKVQVKYRPLNYTKDDPDDGLDPSEQYADNHFRHTNDDHDGSINERTMKTNQPFDDYE